MSIWAEAIIGVLGFLVLVLSLALWDRDQQLKKYWEREMREEKQRAKFKS